MSVLLGSPPIEKTEVYVCDKKITIKVNFYNCMCCLVCLCICNSAHYVPLPHSDSVSSSPSAGLYELLAALPSQLQPHVSRPEDNTFLQDMFGERSLHSLIKVKQKNSNLFFGVMGLLSDSVKMCFSFNSHVANARTLQLSKGKFISIIV